MIESGEIPVILSKAQLMERYRRGKAHRARTGSVNVLFWAPFGYRYLRKTDHAGAAYEIIEHEAVLVAEMFRRYADDGASIADLARWLASQGALTRTGKSRWDRSVVWAMLRNPAYAGTAVFGETMAVAGTPAINRIARLQGRSVPRAVKTVDRPKEEWTQIPVPAIVTEDTFARVQQWLEDNKRFASRNSKVPSLLQGLAACSACGYGPTAVWRLARLMGGADVVHVHDVYYGSSVLAASLAKWRRRPLFITQAVGIVEHDKAVVKFVQKVVYSSVGRLLWRWATTITAYNPLVAGFLSQHGVPAEKVRLTYNGVDTRHFCPGDPAAVRAIRRRYGLPPEIPVILFVGRLVPKKGFQKLLEARGPEYEVVIAGPGRITDQIPAGVTFLGPVNRNDLRDLYQASDIFAFPAVGEILTLVMQEAMACGLPVVATADEAYSPYDLDPSGVAFVPPEPEILRSTFLGLLGQPDRMRYMRAYSRRLAEERFDWQSNAEHLASEYEIACKPGHGR